MSGGRRLLKPAEIPTADCRSRVISAVDGQIILPFILLKYLHRTQNRICEHTTLYPVDVSCTSILPTPILNSCNISDIDSSTY